MLIYMDERSGLEIMVTIFYICNALMHEFIYAVQCAVQWSVYSVQQRRQTGGGLGGLNNFGEGG